MSDSVEPQEAASPQLSVPRQTPLYHAFEQGRYTRQAKIAEIQEFTGRRLISYVAAPQWTIQQSDIPPIVDLLQDVDEGSDLDLLLHTLGGDIDQAERIVLLCRRKIGKEAQFRVIVPDSAKSAGTLIALGADEIVMGYASELGPIDPQITITTAGGESMTRPAQSFKDGLRSIIDESEDGNVSPAYFPLLDKLDPALIDFCDKAIERSKKFAREYLRLYMLKHESDEKINDVVDVLVNADEHLSHGAVIDAERAHRFGLKIASLDPDDDLWQAYWRLYCDQRLTWQSPRSRLYEGQLASLSLHG